MAYSGGGAKTRSAAVVAGVSEWVCRERVCCQTFLYCFVNFRGGSPNCLKIKEHGEDER